MTDNVVLLETKTAKVQTSLIEMLEDLLVMAKSGEILAAASAIIYADGHTGSFASENQHAAKMIGATAILTQELVANAIDNGHMVVGRPKPPDDEPAS